MTDWFNFPLTQLFSHLLRHSHLYRRLYVQQLVRYTLSNYFIRRQIASVNVCEVTNLVKFLRQATQSRQSLKRIFPVMYPRKTIDDSSFNDGLLITITAVTLPWLTEKFIISLMRNILEILLWISVQRQVSVQQFIDQKNLRLVP